jgi:bifunctional NMN adenylyltransferase/nudix hydrolase
MANHEYIVFIGRFSPFHTGHSAIVKTALDQCKKLIIVIGSHNQAPNPRNPFSSKERQELILSALEPTERERVEFVFVRDYNNLFAWVKDIQNGVAKITGENNSIALIGHQKDFTSSYLAAFKDWGFIDYTTHHYVNAGKIRELYFRYDFTYKAYLHHNVISYLEAFAKTKRFSDLKASYDHLCEIHEQWRGAPYTPIFSTINLVIHTEDHILVRNKSGRYGNGLIALPEVFINSHEAIKTASERYLEKIVGFNVDFSFSEKVFDYPLRSLRGRYITFVSNICVHNRDIIDNNKFFWLPKESLSELEDKFFEDNWLIIREML